MSLYRHFISRFCVCVCVHACVCEIEAVLHINVLFMTRQIDSMYDTRALPGIVLEILF